ncbi:MAG: winged helix DNA-binding domain-containing protein [Sandaracinaceae bacterium]
MGGRPLEVTEAQALAFRARRGHLAGGGAASPVDAARAVVGIQAQVEGPALWSLAMRCADPPTAEALSRRILEARDLIRIWAQRDTLHLYAAADWPLVAAADPCWPISGRRGASPPDEALAETRRRMAAAGGVATRADLFDVATDEMVADMAERVPAEQARRYAAGRLPWRLSHLGEVCLGPKVGREQGYALRSHWLPDLELREIEPEEATRELTRRYLAVNGPATARDVAHYFGTKIGDAKSWIQGLGDEVRAVRCEGRDELFVLAQDADDLSGDDAPPPPRLLAAYDTLLMSHHDKTWTVPQESERSKVWRRLAHVSAVVLAGGRAVAVWTHKKTKKRLTVSVEPLSGWRKRDERALAADAEALAEHLGVPGVEVRVR